MGTKQSHIINRVFVEVETNSSAKAHDIRTNSSEFIQSNVLIYMDEYLEKIEPIFEDVTLQLEPIELNISYEKGNIGSLNLKEEITAQLDEIFNPIIRSVSEKKEKEGGTSREFSIKRDAKDKSQPSENISLLTKEAKDVKTILYFLETGRAPWWIQKHSDLREILDEKNILQLLEANADNFVSKMKQALRMESVRKRVVRQFSNNLVTEILLILLAEKANLSNPEVRKSLKKNLLQFLNAITSQERIVFLDLIFTLSQKQTIDRKDAEEISHLFNSSSKQKSALDLCSELFGKPFQSIFENQKNSIVQSQSDKQPDTDTDTVTPDDQGAHDRSQQEILEREALDKNGNLESSKVQPRDEETSNSDTKSDPETQLESPEKQATDENRTSEDTNAKSTGDHELNLNKTSGADIKSKASEAENIHENKTAKSSSDEKLTSDENKEEKEVREKTSNEPPTQDAKSETIQAESDRSKKEHLVENKDATETQKDKESPLANAKAEKLTEKERTQRDQQETQESNQKQLDSKKDDATARENGDAKASSTESNHEDSDSKSSTASNQGEKNNDSAQTENTANSESVDFKKEKNIESETPPNKKTIETDPSENSGEKLESNKLQASEELSELLRDTQNIEYLNPPMKSPDGSFVSENAGLVILQPFLKPFFSNLGLLNENNELTDRVLAAHILHYLATGIEEDFEFSMVIEAYLCGLPFDEPIPRSVPLSEEVKKACDELLMAVLTHWKALKSTSIPLLRHEFLQRSGKLFLNEDSPRIVVERRTIDILLNKIPWTIGIFKLPWRKQLIYVEW